MYHRRGFEGGAPSRRRLWKSGGEAPSRWAIFLRSPQKSPKNRWAIFGRLGDFFAVGRLQESYFIAIESHFASV